MAADPTAGLCDYCGHSTTHYDHTACTPEAEAARDTDHGDPGPDLPEQVAGWTVPDTTNEENERMSNHVPRAIRTIDDEIDARAERQQPTSETRARTLARHQVAEHLFSGIVCLCGAELADLNAPVEDATVTGRALAMAVHQLQELEATEATR